MKIIELPGIQGLLIPRTDCFYLEVWILGEGFLQIPAHPARIENPQEGTDEEIPPKYGHDGKEKVHNGQFDQFLSKHCLPTQLPQLDFLLEIVLVLVGDNRAVIEG